MKRHHLAAFVGAIFLAAAGYTSLQTPINVRTVAELALVKGSTTAPKAVVSGFYTNGDWGAERTAYYVAGATNTVNTGCVVTNATGRWIFYDCNTEPWDIRWFGALPGDTNADAAIINAAIESRAEWTKGTNTPGGTILLSGDGDYLINETIIMRERVSLEGARPPIYSSAENREGQIDTRIFGQSPTRLRLGTNSDCIFIKFNGDTNRMWAVQDTTDFQEDGHTAFSYHYGSAVRNLTLLYDPQTRWDCHPFYAEHAWGITIENIAVNFWRGHLIWALDCNAINVRNIKGSGGSGSKGGMFWGSGDIKITDWEIGGMRGPGIWFTGLTSGRGRVSENFVFNNIRERMLVTALVTNTGVFTVSTEHKLETGMLAEWYSQSGTPPTGLTANQPYWVIKDSDTTLRFATTKSNALAGTAMTYGGTYSGSTNFIWRGQGGGLYGSWGSADLIVVNNRFEQHQEPAVLLNGTTGWSINGNLLYYCQYDTLNNLPEAEPSAGIRVMGDTRFTTGSDNVFSAALPNYPQAYGTHVVTNVASSKDRAIMFVDNVYRDLQVTNNLIESGNPWITIMQRAESMGGPEIGYLGAGQALRLKGGASGVRMLQFERSGVSTIGITPSGDGSNDGLLMFNETLALNMGLWGASADTVTIRMGGTGSGQAASRTALIEGDAPAGVTDVNATNFVIRMPRGTGAGLVSGSRFTIQGPIPGGSGTTQQSLQSLFHVVALPQAGQSSIYIHDGTNLLPVYIGPTNSGPNGTNRALYLQ